jgi:tRNA-2-methylthio-N6-dimethylallyladenosine synthase
MIIGFCTETEEDHQDTLSLMEYCKYDISFMYAYSERPGTLAERRYTDDVPEETKQRRLQEIVDLHRSLTLKNQQADMGAIHEVLVEGPSKKNAEEFCGRTDTNKFVIFPKGKSQKNDYIKVKIVSCTSATLKGEIVE